MSARPAVRYVEGSCSERVCWCHDADPPAAPLSACGSCGCRYEDTPESPRLFHLEASEAYLRLALVAAKRGSAPRLADKIRHAIKSAGGALRHADHDAARARRKGGK